MDIQIPQIIFQTINFSVVVGALTYLLYKPVGKMLESRSKRIEESQQAATEILQEKEALAALKQKTIQAAEKQAQEIIAKAHLSAKKEAEGELATLMKKAEKQVEKLKADWQVERKKQETELRKSFTESVILVTEKIIGKLDAKTKTKIANQDIEALLK